MASRVGRRGLVAGAAALAAAAVARFSPGGTAHAAPGDPFRLEQENTVNSGITALTRSVTGSIQQVLQITNARGNGVQVLSSSDGAGIESRGAVQGVLALATTGGTAVRARIQIPGGADSSGLGVYGSIAGSSLAGIYGEAVGEAPAVRAKSTAGPGVYAEGSPAINAVPKDGGNSNNGVGVRAQTSVGQAVLASSNHPSGTALYGENTGAGTAVRGVCVGSGDNAFAGLFTGRVKVEGNFEATGIKQAVVDVGGGESIGVFCLEGTEPYFEDWGRAQLQNGVAAIAIDGDFARVTSLDGYMVTLTPEGACNGLFVARRDSGGFLVAEQGGGTSNVSFVWRLLARRGDVAAQVQRLPRTRTDRPRTDPPAGPSRGDRILPPIPSDVRGG